MTIVLQPETEARLSEIARREGQDTQALAQAWLTESLAWYEREFAENVRAIQEGLDAVDQGASGLTKNTWRSTVSGSPILRQRRDRSPN